MKRKINIQEYDCNSCFYSIVVIISSEVVDDISVTISSAVVNISAVEVVVVESVNLDKLKFIGF